MSFQKAHLENCHVLVSVYHVQRCLPMSCSSRSRSRSRRGSTRPGRSRWSMSTPPTSDRTAIPPRYANTRNASTRRSCVQLYGVKHKNTHTTPTSATLRSTGIQQPGLCVCVCRSESAGRDGERPDAVGSKRSGQSLQSDQSTALPADGRSGGTQCSGHHLRLVRLLSPSNMHNS